MSNNPITVIRIHHGGPPGTITEHTNTLRPGHPKCSCGRVWATFNEDGSVGLDGDVAYFPVTVSFLVAGVGVGAE